ncbi:MAG: transaldolase, partial [Hyphomicrobiaceae bacterium]|nr:transaldolase [Hyphomicrobiaceae bacterium]
MRSVNDLKIRIFADGADFDSIIEIAKNPLVQGFTTNPSLIARAGEKNYEDFARKVIAAVPDRPCSFEIIADDFDEMINQARKISSWGSNVNVKVPVTNTKGVFAGEVIKALSNEGIILNITAVFTPKQVEMVADAIVPGAHAMVSVFAGRIADTGVDPLPIMR